MTTTGIITTTITDFLHSARDMKLKALRGPLVHCTARSSDHICLRHSTEGCNKHSSRSAPSFLSSAWIIAPVRRLASTTATSQDAGNRRELHSITTHISLSLVLSASPVRPFAGHAGQALSENTFIPVVSTFGSRRLPWNQPSRCTLSCPLPPHLRAIPRPLRPIAFYRSPLLWSAAPPFYVASNTKPTTEYAQTKDVVTVGGCLPRFHISLVALLRRVGRPNPPLVRAPHPP